jgi:type IV pilus assembly protein PilA
MFHTLRGRARDERGFTLVEAMVVVLIIGILLSIAIPTFMGARTRAQDGSAKSSLRNTLTAAGVIYTDNESYKDANAKALAQAEGSISYLDSPKSSGGADTVSVSAKDPFGAAAKSQSGNCFYVLAQANGKTLYGSSKAGKCTGDEAAKYAKSTKF